MKYELIGFVLCPYAQRSVITLKEKQVPFELTHIDPNQLPKWFATVSPLGKVPVLRKDGSQILFESAVINEYLDETNLPPLHPQDPWQRAQNRAWIEFGSNLLGRQYQMMMATDEARFFREQDGLLADLRFLERELGAGPWFNGTAFSLLDIAYAPFFMRLDLIERRVPQNLLAEMPKMSAWSKALLARPAVQESVVADFEDRFVRACIDEGGYLGQRLAS